MIQQTKNIFLLFLTVSFFSIFSSCSEQTIHSPVSDAVENTSVLQVSMDAGTPGYLRFNGEYMGYTYDLLNAYTQSFGQTLEILPVNKAFSYSKEPYGSNRPALTVTLQPSLTPINQTAIPVFETSYVVLAASKKMQGWGRNSDINMLFSGRNIGFLSGFSETQSYEQLETYLPDISFEPAAGNVFESFEGLVNGRFDFLICEKSEAQLGLSLVRNIEQVYQFEEAVTLYVQVDYTQPEEGRRFSNWLHGFRQSEAAEELHALYFGKGISQRIISGGVKNRSAGSISVYDDLFKKVAREEKLDWRLVSAIAYSESKYNAYLVSPKGARGLMQVMPATARAFEVDVDELMDPEANVRVAVKLIRNIEKSLKFSEGTSQEDRTRIMLACYNGGIGHVTDARRLASKHGGNPDSWSDVSHYLGLKSQPEYAEDEVVKCGVFKGAGETKKFVSHVMGKYYAYCGGK